VETNRRTFVAATGATLAGIGLAGCSETDPDDGDFDPADIEGDLNDDEISEHVEVTEHGIFEEGDDVGVTGAVENVSGEQLDYVEVEVTLNDGDTLIGEFVDTTDEEIDSLGPGETWDFRVTFGDEDLNEDVTYSIGVEAETAEEAVEDDGDIAG